MQKRKKKEKRRYHILAASDKRRYEEEKRKWEPPELNPGFYVCLLRHIEKYLPHANLHTHTTPKHSIKKKKTERSKPWPE